MKTEITRPDLDDVVFESRNKEYGAYAIRKSYDENVSKASLMALLFVALVFGIIQVASLLRVEIKTVPSIPKIDGLINPPIVIHNPKKLIFKSEQIVNKNLTPITVKNDVIDLPPVKAVEPSQVGTDIGTTTVLISVSGDNLQGNNAPPAAIEPAKIIDIAEVMPQYEGGLKAMSKFISKNIHYPASARMMGQEGTVYVRFVVNDLGQVVDVEVIRGVSAVLDQEALRVIALMYKWKPGMQHNLAVNVRMVLPIKFQLEQ